MLTGMAENDPEAQARVTAFLQGLRALGWVDGRNVRIDFRWGTGEAEVTQRLAKEAVERKPDLIVGSTTPMVSALVQETRTIPILFVQVVDPVGRGFVANLGRPGGNVTGFINFEFPMGGKWLETLKEAAPGVKRVALLYNPQTAPFGASFTQVIAAAAPGLRPSSRLSGGGWRSWAIAKAATSSSMRGRPPETLRASRGWRASLPRSRPTLSWRLRHRRLWLSNARHRLFRS